MSTNLDDFIAFPSIGQFRNVIKNVQSTSQYLGKDEEGNVLLDRDAISPALTYRGYVKLHGTNAAVISNPDGSIYPQSRKRVLTVESDNFGFADFVYNRVGNWDKLFGSIAVCVDADLSNSKIAVYGEWCGPGVQKNVALDQLKDKCFVIFAVRLIHSDDTTEWLSLSALSPDMISPHDRVKFITEFPFYGMTIDFAKPSLSQNSLAAITEKVEECCPVAKALGGVEGIGEGVVWICTDEGRTDESYWFKVKGEKHSVSNVKTLAEVDPELVKSCNEFIDLTVTENRLQQGVQTLVEDGVELSIKSTGVFLKWVYQDILKEESDVLEASHLSSKAIGGPISKKAKDWWFKWLEENQ